MKRFGTLLGAAVACALHAAPASAASHALIMWIGTYSNPRANLPGIDLDAQAARRIARAMGVPERNTTEVSNEQLTTEGVASAFRRLADRVQPNDKVFIYYSGHGGQIQGNSPTGCSEGMFVHDMKFYLDDALQADLERLASRAGRIVMLNDSCFSGGQASTDKRMGPGALVAKNFKDGPNPASCGVPVNKFARSLEVASARKSNNFVYIAAAANNEVAFASDRGSSATIAWHDCLTASADRDRSGALTGAELAACAQQKVTAMGYRQTITLSGNQALPLALAPDADGNAPVRANRALEDLRAASTPNISVALTLSTPSVRVGSELDFTVTTNTPGYLYLLHVGTRNDDFTLLFPNGLDGNNFIQAGTVALPRPNWRVRAGGPAGTGYLLAIVSPTQKNLAQAMTGPGAFKSAPATVGSGKTLEAVAADGASPYGASAVVPIQEQ